MTMLPSTLIRKHREEKEHIGYIIDRTGFERYRKWALKGVQLSEGTGKLSSVLEKYKICIILQFKTDFIKKLL